MLNSFKEEFSFLENARLVAINNGEFKYIGEWSMEGLFDYFSYTKIFYGKYLLSELEKVHKRKYNPNYQYTFHKDGFIRKTDDPFFLLTFYEIGY